MITIENITSHEFIGLHTKVTDSTNSQVIGLNGTVIDETKSMITINTSKGEKSIPKSNSSWKFTIENQDITINGSKIEKRPHDRIGVKL